jgi:hypothetical protein
MRGEFLRAWTYMWPEVWQRLTKHPDGGQEILCEVYEAIEELPSRLREGQTRPTVFKAPVADEADLTIRNTPDAAAQFFQRLAGRRFRSEKHAIQAIERIAIALEESYPTGVAQRFKSLIKSFVRRHGLHYRIGAPLSFRPSIAGITCGLISQVEQMGDADPAFGQLVSECQEAFDDLKHGPTEARVKSCIGKQMNVAEAIARKHCQSNKIQVMQWRNGQQVAALNPALSAMSNELGTWPHIELKNSLRKFYEFTNDYPGIRHPGNRNSAIRPLALRDAVAGLVLTIGFAAYLTDAFDHGRIYGV